NIVNSHDGGTQNLNTSQQCGIVFKPGFVDSRGGEQHLLLAIFIHIVVKKDPEACSGELGGGVGHLLQDPLNVHLFRDALSQPIEDLQVAGVLLYLFLGLYLLADVSRNFGGTYYSALTVLDWRNRDGDIDLVSILMQSPGLK